MHVSARPGQRRSIVVAVIGVVGASVISMAITGLNGALALSAIAVLVIASTSVAIVARSGLQGLVSVLIFGAATLIPLNGIRISESVSGSDVLLLLASTIAAFQYLTSPTLRQWDLSPVEPSVWGGILLCLGALTGSLFSGDVTGSLISIIKVLIVAVILPILFAFWNPSPFMIRAVVIVWTISVSLNSLLAVFGMNYNPYTGRSRALTLHPNHLALVAVIALGFALGLWLSSTRIEAKALWIGSGLFSLFGIYISGSRAGLIGVFAAMMIFSITLRNWKVILWLLSLAASLLLSTTFLQGIFSPESAVARLLGASGSGSASDEGRTDALREGLLEVSHHLFTGIGFAGTNAYHNLPLQILAATGIVGFCGFALIVWTYLCKPVVQGLQGYGISDQRFLAGLLAAYGGFLAADLFQNAIWERFAWFPVALIAVALWSYRRPILPHGSDVSSA